MTACNAPLRFVVPQAAHLTISRGEAPALQRQGTFVIVAITQDPVPGTRRYSTRRSVCTRLMVSGYCRYSGTFRNIHARSVQYTVRVDNHPRCHDRSFALSGYSGTTRVQYPDTQRTGSKMRDGEDTLPSSTRVRTNYYRQITGSRISGVVPTAGIC